MRTINPTKCFLVVSLCSAAVTACDFAPTDGGVQGDPAVVEAGDIQLVEHEIVAVVEPDEDTTIVFTREPVGDDPDLFAIGTKLVGPDGGIAYEKFIAEQELSPLEVFLAFAPDGAEAPAELLVSHDMTVRAQGRASAEPRELVMPRAISTVDSVYCDSYTNFQTHVNSYWTNYGHARAQALDNSTASHVIGKNNWQSAYGTICNADDVAGDTKDAYLCSRSSGDPMFSCESVTLLDGYRGYKTWSPVYIGSGGYKLFDYQLIGANTGGQERRSFLGLVVVAWIG